MAPLEPGDGAHVDDRAPTRLDHVRDAVLGHQHHGFHVHAHAEVPLVRIDLDSGAGRAEHADVVHEHVDAAEAAHSRGDGLRTRPRLGDVADDDRHAALGGQELLSLRRGCVLSVEDGDLRTVASHQERGGASVADSGPARAGARDDDGLAGELPAYLVGSDRAGVYAPSSSRSSGEGRMVDLTARIASAAAIASAIPSSPNGNSVCISYHG